MGIPAQEDGLFVNFLILDYLYVGGRIVGSARCGGCGGGGGGGRTNAFRALPPGRYENNRVVFHKVPPQ